MEVRQRRKAENPDEDSPKPYGGDKILRRGASLFMKLTIILAVLVSIILAIGYLMSPIEPESQHWVKDVELTGRLEVNSRLTEGKRLDLVGAECIVEDDRGNIYTGLKNGQIMKIHRSRKDKVGEGRQELLLTSRFPGLVSTDPSATHGQPLGLRVRNEKLYVMDAIYGLYTIELKSRKVQFLIKPDDVSPSLGLPDDFDISKDGSTIYFTDATTKFSVFSSIYAIFEGSCTGRLFQYDVKTKHIHVLKKKLCFANGVQLNEKGNTLLVVETVARRVLYYDTRTWVIKYRLFLPTIPDNIRRNSRGNYWVGTAGPHTFWSRLLFSEPFINRIVTGLVPKKTLLNIVDGHHSILVEANATGHVIQSLHDPQGQLVYGLSHGSDLSDGRVVLGSYFGHMAIHEYKQPPLWYFTL